MDRLIAHAHSLKYRRNLPLLRYFRAQDTINISYTLESGVDGDDDDRSDAPCHYLTQEQLQRVQYEEATANLMTALTERRVSGIYLNYEPELLSDSDQSEVVHEDEDEKAERDRRETEEAERISREATAEAIEIEEERYRKPRSRKRSCANRLRRRRAVRATHRYRRQEVRIRTQIALKALSEIDFKFNGEQEADVYILLKRLKDFARTHQLTAAAQVQILSSGLILTGAARQAFDSERLHDNFATPKDQLAAERRWARCSSPFGCGAEMGAQKSELNEAPVERRRGF